MNSTASTPARLRRIAASACLVIAAGVGLSACGGGSATTATSSPPGGGQGFQAFQDCLKNHGVTLPTGGPPNGNQGNAAPPSGNGFPGGSNSAMSKAFKECQSLAPSGGPPGGFGGSNG